MNAKQQKQLEETLDKCRNMMRLQHKAWATEETYIPVIRSYIQWVILHGAQFMDSRSRIEAYLTKEALRGVAASTQNVAFNAILYLYETVRGEKVEGIQALRAKRPQHAKTSLPREVTLKLVAGVPEYYGGYPTRFLAQLLYGLGLRVTEPLNLRVKDIDVLGSRVVIRGAKGGKDRTLRVPCALMIQLQAQLKVARAIWESDHAVGMPVQVPELLGKKYKKATFSWQWAWVFPSRNTCPHPRTGERVRYRMHEANVQRAVKVSATKLGVDSVATPHILRHCYATHVMDSGANILDLQQQLGHSHVNTTMIYTHGSGERIRSPLEVLI
jgi:site-specific recombinase XerD